jgi:hypothetical protein
MNERSSLARRFLACLLPPTLLAGEVPRAQAMVSEALLIFSMPAWRPPAAKRDNFGLYPNSG